MTVKPRTSLKSQGPRGQAQNMTQEEGQVHKKNPKVLPTLLTETWGNGAAVTLRVIGQAERHLGWFKTNVWVWLP